MSDGTCLRCGGSGWAPDVSTAGPVRVKCLCRWDEIAAWQERIDSGWRRARRSNGKATTGNQRDGLEQPQS